MENRVKEIQRAILILKLYLSFVEVDTDLNDEDKELAAVLREHSVIKAAYCTSPNKQDYLPL